MTLAIRREEFEQRADALAERLGQRGLAGAVLFDSNYVLYYTGFAFIPTERPIAVAIAADGGRGMLVPRLELEHAQSNVSLQHVEHYAEYPSREHPTESLRRCSREASSAPGRRTP